jgi:hypothetical protein
MSSLETIYKPSAQRFQSGIEYQKSLLNLTRSIQQRMLNNLPSNYPKTQNTNLAEFFRSVAKEFARLQMASSDVSEYKFHTQTKAEYLFQILGDSLFLGERTINENLDDISYRNFLIKVRNAYFKGSRRDNIESAVSDIIGLPVILKEVYLNLREEDSAYTLKDTHRMFFDILMDEVGASTTIGTMLEDISFFIDLIKPAHVLYNTRLIWSDEFVNTIGNCKPSYITQNMEYEVYGTSIIYRVTYLAKEIYKYSGEDTEETWTSGIISSIDSTSGIFNLIGGTILVYNSGTTFYIRTEDGDSSVSFEVFEVGDEIKYYATKDSMDSSAIIDDTWGFVGVIYDIFPDEEILELTDGSLIVYNSATLAYTRDYSGEFRIELSDLVVGNEIAFKAEKYTRSFQFYITPEEVQQNFFKQFDSKVMSKSSFQEYVKKEKSIREGYAEGYNIVIENGVAIVKNIKSMFFKKESTSNYKEVAVHKYSLYINGKYAEQFQVKNPERSLTLEEAKNLFVYEYGYTGLQSPEINYNIKVSRTGILEEDSTESVVQAVDAQTEFCDQKANCILDNIYEDTRRYYTWPDPKLTSGFFSITHEFEATDPLAGAFDVGAWYYLSSDPNTFTMPLLPMLNGEGNPAGITDITIYLNGRKISDAVTYIDPWEGIIGLNFIPPFDSKLRIDYYFAKRYPDQVYYLRQIRNEIPVGVPNDLPGIFTVIGEGSKVSRLTWPFDVTTNIQHGDDLDYQMDKFPILNKRGELATANDIIVQVGSSISSGNLKVVNIDTALGKTTLESVDSDWVGVSNGDTIIIIIPNYLDNTQIYYIESIDLISNTCIVPNLLPIIGAEYPYTVIKFIDLVGGVTDTRSLLGHIRVNFIPPVNSYLKFNYFYTSQKRNYLMMPDAPIVSGSAQYGSSPYTPDTFYNSNNRYTMLVDQNPDMVDHPYWDFEELLKIGYRYRAFNLSNSSVLNSERMILNDYQRDKGKASFNNGPSNLNRFGLLFSPEYLKDKDKNIALNDLYLTKDIQAITILNPGIPIFTKTYTDDGHHKTFVLPIEEETYNPSFEGGVDLKASFSIIEPDNSGIIDYNSICDFTEKKKINLYSDLKIVEHNNGGYDAPLSTIDEAGTSIPFRFTYIDQYYPDREMRVNDYLDFINQVPSEIRYGEMHVLNGSDIVKSRTINFRALNIGDLITLKDVPFTEWIRDTGWIGTPDPDHGHWGTVHKNIDFTLIEIIDFETGRFSRPYKGTSGEYSYVLSRSKTYAVDVGLAGGYGETGCIYGNVHRQVFPNNAIGFTYGLPMDQISHYGLTGLESLCFSDPDPDPYPRNPDNPWIGHPSVSYYNIEPSIIDGKTYITNRTKGVTGIVRTSIVIDSEGMSQGFTGAVSLTGSMTGLHSIGYHELEAFSGVTGPVGALNLGITGPVEYANPRTIDDYDVYSIPSGDTGIYISYSEAEYRVQWRNFDQDMILINLTSSGIIEEDPLNMMDDLGDNILMTFWDVNVGAIREIRFSGTVITSAETESLSAPAALYPMAFILLTPDQRDAIGRVSNPVITFPEYHLNDINYKVNKFLIRELLQDELTRITEIHQMVPIV